MSPRLGRFRRIIVTLPLLLPAALVPGGTARAVERDGYGMEILVDGVPLTEYPARGTRYVEALKGRDYSIRLRNGTGARVAIALSVDGLNSIDARTTSASEARKWVLEPYETITLDGWQTSSTTARRFVFTTEPGSYGAWLGRTENLGVVAAAVFREKRPRVIALEEGGRKDQARREAAQGAAPEGRIAPMAAEPAPSDDLAATGIGREVTHDVRLVHLDLEDAPAALLETRYEFRETLVRLGVLPAGGRCEDALARREKARGFADLPFAPDPCDARNSALSSKGLCR